MSINKDFFMNYGTNLLHFMLFANHTQTMSFNLSDFLMDLGKPYSLTIH